MKALPTKALSIRQPWAWAIVHGGKRIENRNWNMTRPENFKFRGTFCIHASRSLTQKEYRDAAEFMETIDVICPPAKDLLRGQIIGTANLVDIVTESESPWFFGPKGLVLADVKPIKPFASGGYLGFFDWRRMGLNATPPKPNKWMLDAAMPSEQEFEGLFADG